MSNILITSYTNPDNDGIACMYAYEEFLRERGKDAKAGYFGRPQLIAEIACEMFDVPMVADAAVIAFDEVVLMDTNHLNQLDPSIDPKQVVEIYDHHTDSSKDFPNAKVQIEMIGAAATLVAEKIFESGALPSKKSAQLLYLAVITGTHNFKSWNTTERDKKIAEKLNQIAKVTDEQIHEFHQKNSEIKRPLYDLLLEDFKYVEIPEGSFGVTVWGTVVIKDFIDKYKEEIISAMNRIRKEKNLDYIWHGSTDLETGQTVFIAPDAETEEVLEEALGLVFNDGECWVDGLVLRKQHMKDFREYLEKNNE